ncbi:MAG: GrpB family protein, partial [Muribaculaceae bacterium]|nr:GrpB family protein [Muribaculaceae bacterium]
YFRDYLNTHSDVAKDYEKLKLSLWKSFEHDRDGYTNAKSDFITHYTTIAKQSL